MPRRSRLRLPRALAGVTATSLAIAVAFTSAAIGATPARDSAGLRSADPDKATVMSGPGPKGDSLLRLISWSGLSWLVYSNASKGPENVKVTNSTRAIWVDSQGRLHLSIVKIDGQWRSVELRSLNTMSYATYRLINNTRTAKFATSTVFGMFIYRPGASKTNGGNEIDVENSRFPNYLKWPNNAQFAVQPYNLPHHEYAYSVKPSFVPLFQQFSWFPPSGGAGVVRFQTRVGTTPRSPLLARWTYYGANDPTNNNMYLYLTLWLNHGDPPDNGTHAVVLRSLVIKPLNG